MRYLLLFIGSITFLFLKAQTPEKKFEKIGDLFTYLMNEKATRFSASLSIATNNNGIVKGKFGKSNTELIDDKNVLIWPKPFSEINSEGSAAIKIYPFKDENEASKAIDKIKAYLATNFCHPNLIYRPTFSYNIGESQFVMGDGKGNFFVYPGNLDFSTSAYQCPEGSNSCIEIRFNNTEEVYAKKMQVIQNFVAVTEPKGYGEFHQQIRTIIEAGNNKKIDFFRIGNPIPNNQPSDYNVYFRSKFPVKGLATELIVHPYIRALLSKVDTTFRNKSAYFLGIVYTSPEGTNDQEKLISKGNDWIKYLSAAVGSDYLYTIKDYEGGYTQFILTSKNPTSHTVIYLNLFRREKSSWIELVIKNESPF